MCCPWQASPSVDLAYVISYRCHINTRSLSSVERDYKCEELRRCSQQRSSGPCSTPATASMLTSETPVLPQSGRALDRKRSSFKAAIRAARCALRFRLVCQAAVYCALLPSLIKLSAGTILCLVWHSCERPICPLVLPMTAMGFAIIVVALYVWMLHYDPTTHVLTISIVIRHKYNAITDVAVFDFEILCSSHRVRFNSSFYLLILRVYGVCCLQTGRELDRLFLIT